MVEEETTNVGGAELDGLADDVGVHLGLELLQEQS